MILQLSEDTSNRNTVLEILEHLRSSSPMARILDFGGGAGSWVGSYATHIVDLQENPVASAAGVMVILGDGHLSETWAQFEDNYFDFVICTHTLEDVRDPSVIASHLSRIGKAGFVAVPNRHQEFGHLESPLWRGNLHHRWLFRGIELGLLATAKTSVLHTSRLRRISKLIRNIPLGTRFKNGISNLAPAISTPWWNRSLSRYSHFGPELSFFWLDGFLVKFLLDDFATAPGEMPLHHALHVEKFLSDECIETFPIKPKDFVRDLLSG